MVWKEILEIRWKAGIGLLVFLTLPVAGPFLFKYMQSNAEINAQLQTLPPEIATRLGDYQMFIHSTWFGQNLLEMGIIFAAILGCTAIAGEVSKRTIEFLLSKPISRFRVLMTKVAVGTVALGVIVLISSILIYPSSAIMGFSVSLTSLVLAAILAWLGLGVMFALAVFFSAIFDDAIKTAVAALVTAVALAVPGWFESVSRFSIYNHMQSYASFRDGTFPFGDAVFLLAAFAGLVSASYLLLRAKEF